MDNNHVIRAARAEGEDAVITFDDDEVLRITRPDAWHFDDQVFRVETAERVEWKWFLYGSPKTPENLYTIEHWVDAAGNVHARSNVDWYQPNFTPSTSEAAVELL
jgi:hypothetical protein